MTDHDFDITARTLYGEARGEYACVGIAGLIAVTNVIVNRWRRKGRYGNTLTEVFLKPRQFSCWNSGDPNRILIQSRNLEKKPLFQLCRRVVQNVAYNRWPDLTRGSDHYHALTCLPFWAKTGKVHLYLGNHIFYKLDVGGDDL